MAWFRRQRGERTGAGQAGEAAPGAADLMKRVAQIQLATYRMVNDVLSGAYRSSFRGSGIEFEEVRPYQPGDDVRSIDWNRTAKLGEAFVKTYVEERELVLSLVVDTSSSMDFGSTVLTKREAAASLCALLAYVAQRQQDRVGLSLFGRTPGLHLPPRKGAGAVARVVREVIAARPTEGGTDLRAVLEQQQRTLRRRSLVFLISDWSGLDGPRWSDALSRLSARHDVIAVVVRDPFEEELPAAGVLRFVELEGGRAAELDTRSPRVREAWREAARQRRAALEAELARARVERIDLSTAGDLAEPLVRFFRRRSGRRSGRSGGVA